MEELYQFKTGMKRITDGDWEIIKVEDVDYYKDLKKVDVGFDDCWRVSFLTNGKYLPKVGDLIKIRRYRGEQAEVICNGITLHQESNKKIDARIIKEQIRWKKKKQNRFNKNKKKYDKWFSDMPEVFQRRIQLFRDNGKNWRIDWEGYEMASCMEALNIVKLFKTENKVKEYMEDYRSANSSIKYTPLDDDHSGNTFGSAIALAYWYLKDPKMVYKIHGIGAALTGCEEYGCVHPRPKMDFINSKQESTSPDH